MENILSAYAEVPSIALEVGYEMKTTFWGDFRVCGTDEAAIRDTYKRALREWKDDKIYGTELALVLNWLSWLYYDKGEEETSKLYVELWHDIDAYICSNWKDEKLDYYVRTTD